ncbi:MAG: homoserine dehydrogenase [Nitrospinae bacterium]|nr:homoserine dehydrogenase [Nitrospinota bacterium]
MKSIYIGLIGFGTVGAGVVKTLQMNGDIIAKRVGAEIRFKRIADLDLGRDRGVQVDRSILTTNAEEILNDPDINIVLELMGGYHPAREFILKGIENGKNIVTANKALLAKHGDEIFAAVEKKGVCIGFEASVGGGIPVIRAIKEGFAGDEILSIRGIVNGTANFILSKMSDEGRDFKAALKEAQRLGYAEADPTFDIEGHDSAHKIAILAMLAFGTEIPIDKVYMEGISRITSEDIAFARQLGYRIKLLAIAKGCGDSLDIRVHPTMVQASNPIANVNGATNAIEIHGRAVGAALLVGEGAGALPTSSAVLGDVIEIARGILCGAKNRLPARSWLRENIQKIPIRPMDEVESECYLRFKALDKPGVLSKISGILGSHNISISSVIQKERHKGSGVPVVMTTHSAVEKNIRKALEEIDKLDIIQKETFSLRLEDGK